MTEEHLIEKPNTAAGASAAKKTDTVRSEDAVRDENSARSENIVRGEDVARSEDAARSEDTARNADLFKDLEFIVELEQMKKIERRTRIIGEHRRENDAEHSWHIAVMAMLLGKYISRNAEQGVDIDKIVKMLLVHDIVEIYAGDTFAYDSGGNARKREREVAAMEKIMSKISPSNAEQIGKLWHEFEKMETEEAVLANAIDRLQPVLSNLYAGDGGTWAEFAVTKAQILKRIEPIARLNGEIYAYLLEKIEENIRKGYIADDAASDRSEEG